MSLFSTGKDILSFLVVLVAFVVLVQHVKIPGSINLKQVADEFSSNYLPKCECNNSAPPPVEVIARNSLLIDSYPVRGPLTWTALNEDLKQEFLLHGKVSLLVVERFGENYFTHGETIRYENSFRFAWKTADILASADRAKTKSNTAHVCQYGEECDRDFFDAFSQFPLAGKDVLVVGSQKPWAESMAIAFNAKSITTVDFNVPIVEDPNMIKTISVLELGENGETFDVLICFSSIEHDGLGRYGDPIHPNGDLERMKKLAGFLRPEGLLFLGVPTGPDTLTWNSHRIYGKYRFPLLIKGWRLLKTFGNFDVESGSGESQPVHVLTPDQDREEQSFRSLRNERA